ncbi:ATPase H+ transporting accessory protein 1 like a isoform X2 [Betta splendens]|uniref:ATPase H+ transporting accessory protein 1 like a isoform X2 n=1 Tax=Betta splendens TaxID=158456 RepID=A0A8M1HEH8_BETSP|nr:ATPase H+ transporting accessory protein 1 like a isoform X2 [Betta splendens]
MREEAVHHSLVTTAMASPWRHCCIQLLSLLLFLCIQASTCLHHEPVARAPVSTVQDEETAWRDGRVWTSRALVPADQMLSQLQAPDASRRKLLQTPGAAVPFPPLRVFTNGKPCILFQARKLSVRYEKQKQLDLTERAFSPPVDTSQSVCHGDKATLVMRFGDVEDLRGLFISVSLLYNSSEEAVFNVTEVYAPASSSYHCLHVSNLQRFSTLLLPSTEQARRWAVTFTDLQIQAFNITSGKFSPASSCTTFLTPAILMGLVTSLILLLVLAYALHMVIHLKHIEHDEEHKAHVYFPPNPEQCCVENVTEKNNQ